MKIEMQEFGVHADRGAGVVEIAARARVTKVLPAGRDLKIGIKDIAKRGFVTVHAQRRRAERAIRGAVDQLEARNPGFVGRARARMHGASRAGSKDTVEIERIGIGLAEGPAKGKLEVVVEAVVGRDTQRP